MKPNFGPAPAVADAPASSMSMYEPEGEFGALPPSAPPSLGKDKLFWSADKKLFVDPALCKASPGDQRATIFVLTITDQKDKDFYAKLDALKGREAQRLAMAYAVSIGISAPAFANTAMTYPLNRHNRQLGTDAHGRASKNAIDLIADRHCAEFDIVSSVRVSI